MDVMEEKIKNMDKDIVEIKEEIKSIKKIREADYDKIVENSKILSNILIELKNITKTMETLTNNWKEAINRSNAMQKNEHETINNKINKLEKTVDKLETKLETNTDSLEQEINDKTVNKDSKNYNDIIITIVKTIANTVITAIITAILMLIIVQK